MTDEVFDVAVSRAEIAQVSGTDPEVFRDLLARADLNWHSLLHWLRAALVKDVDYGVIPNVSTKPSLWKPGAEKIAGRLGWRRTFPDAEKYVNAAVAGQKIETVALRCHLYNAAGDLIGEGMGAYEATQKQRQWEGSGRERRITGYIDVYDVNKALKLAEKRAFVDAVLSTSGLSAVFTQDLPDDNADTTPLAERQAELKYLEAKAAELFGDGWLTVLQSYAVHVEKIAGGDYSKIPTFKLAYVVSRLERKAAEQEKTS